MSMDEQQLPEHMSTDGRADDFPIAPKKGIRGKTLTKPGPKVPLITNEQVFELAALGCTVDECAATLRVDPKTILNNFGTAHREGHASLCYQLRKKQVELALKGNVTMLIFLGKAYLSQFDTQRIETKVEQTTKFETAEELKNKLEELIASKMARYTRNVA